MRTTRIAAAIAVPAVIGLVVSVAAVWPRLPPESPVRGSEPGPPVAAAAAVPSPAPARSPSAARTETDVPARPARLRMPDIGLGAAVRPVGVADDGQMQLPRDPRLLGWYRFGPAPSEAGSVVVAGHLDSSQFGLGPLVRLREAGAGDTVEVTGTDGSTTSYSVVAVDRYDRQALPARLFSRTGPPRLRIITCGGDYDADAGGYQRNLVVTAAPM